MALIVAGLFWLAPNQTLGRTLYVLDFDGSINNDHSPNPAWKTPWILFRVESVRSLMQKTPGELQLPETIDVSYQEYLRLRPLLAKGPTEVGELNAQALVGDPLWTDRPNQIIPGYYFVDRNHSFKYYRPGRKRKNYLLRDYKDALSRRQLDPSSGDIWGLAFPLLETALSREFTVGDVVILTARDHEAREFREFLRALKEDGFIRHAAGRNPRGQKQEPRFLSMHAPEALVFGRDGSVARRKAQAVLDLARQLVETSDGLEHEELSFEEDESLAGVTRKMHTMIVAEDSPSNVDAIRRALEELSSELGFQSKVKFVLLNTGDESAVKESRWPYRWTVFRHGFGRAARPEEILRWTTPMTATPCEELLR
jgi:hypothetical protein